MKNLFEESNESIYAFAIDVANDYNFVIHGKMFNMDGSRDERYALMKKMILRENGIMNLEVDFHITKDERFSDYEIFTSDYGKVTIAKMENNSLITRIFYLYGEKCRFLYRKVTENQKFR